MTESTGYYSTYNKFAVLLLKIKLYASIKVYACLTMQCSVIASFGYRQNVLCHLVQKKTQ